MRIPDKTKADLCFATALVAACYLAIVGVAYGMQLGWW